MDETKVTTEEEVVAPVESTEVEETPAEETPAETTEAAAA